MGGNLRERIKPVVALLPKSLAGTNATGRYFPIEGFDKALVVITCAQIAYADPGTPNKVVAQIIKAKNAAALDAADLTGFTATINGQVKAMKGNVLVTGVTNDVTMTINGIVYTKKAATAAANREFADAQGLTDCVNHATMGVPGVLAAVNATNVTLTSKIPDSLGIDMVGYESAKLVPTTEEALALIEIDEGDLGGGLFTHFAVKLTTTGTIICAADVIFGKSRRSLTPVASAKYPA